MKGTTRQRIKVTADIPVNVKNLTFLDTASVTWAVVADPATDAAEVSATASGGGGGTSDHALLTHLSWSASAHTGTASRFAVFGAGGAAAELAYPSTGLVGWTGSAWQAVTVSAPLGYSAGALSLSYSTGLTTSGGALVVDTTTIATLSAVAAAYQPLDSDLTALAGLSSTGFLARTGAGTAAARSLVPGAGISITNQDGASGNPTISVNSEIPSNAANTRIYYTQAEQTSLIWTGISGFNTGSGTISVVSGITNTYNALQVTATNANSNWPVRPGAQNVRIGHNPVFTGRFISAATTADHRIWLCFATSIGTGSTPSGQGCGVVFDPSTSANWRVYSYDGTTMSYTDTGVAYAANTMYQWSVRTTSSGVYVKIWDVTGSEPSEVSHTTNLPAAGTNMYAGLFLLFRITAGSSTIKFFSQQCSMAINNA